MAIFTQVQLVSASNATYTTNGANLITAAQVRTLNDNWVSSSILAPMTASMSVLSASYAATASVLLGSVVSASYAQTASYANIFFVSQSLTASGLNYPTVDGLEGQVIKTDGTNDLSFGDVNTIFENVYAGENLTKGDPLYISGSQGSQPKVFKADAGVASKMPVTYIAAETITANNATRGIVLGQITGINLTGYAPGTEVYVAVGGGWTSTRPTGTAIVQLLGLVTQEGSGGQGLVLNPGPANLPNLNSGSVWVGNASSIPTAVATSSLTVLSSSFANNANSSISSSYASSSLSSSYAVTASFALNAAGGGSSFPFTGSAIISGSLVVTGSTQSNLFSGSVASSTASVDLNTAGVFTFALTANATTFFNFTNIGIGRTANIIVTTATAATASFSSNVKQPTGSLYTPSSGSGRTDILSALTDGTNVYLTYTKTMA